MSAYQGSGSARNKLVKAALETLEERRLFALAVAPFTPGSASTLTNALLLPGTGINASNSTYVGSANQGGTFSGFNFSSGGTALSLNDGIVLTNGLASSATSAASISASSNLGTSGDTDLNALVSTSSNTVTTYDANTLTITFTTTPGTKSILFDFVFASDEFPVYVGSYNDAFGAYLDGKQVSFDSANRPITVNNNFFSLNNSGDTTDSDTVGKTVVSFPIVYGGLTTKITTQAPLNLNQTTHTLKLVIADAGDSAVDSAIFLSHLRGSTAVIGEPTSGQPPVVDAHGPYTVPVNGTVTLNGTATDPDQAANTLSYAWDLDGDGIFGEAGAAAANGNETGGSPTYKAGAVTGTKTVTLRVTDKDGISSTDTATINIVASNNQNPVASAGGPYTINEGSSITLNGSATDADGDPLTYAWDLNNDGKFDDATGAKPTVSWATLAAAGINDDGTYPIIVQVTDGKGGLGFANTTISVKNVAPTANAGPDMVGALSTPITLKGSATDPAGAADPLTYAWTVTLSGVAVASGNGANITFTPASNGSYLATLTATDDDGGVGTDSATVVVGNSGPTGTIKGRLWNDTNGNGKWDGKEGNTLERHVFLDDNGNGVLDAGEKSVTSDKNGYYTINDVPVGNQVRLTRWFPKNFRLSNPTPGTNGLDLLVNVIAGVTTTADLGTYGNVKAPSTPQVSIAGHIVGTLWNDTNGDGIYEPLYEAATGHRTVFIDTNGNGILDKGETWTTSDLHGHYDFKTDIIGTVTICRIFPTGYFMSNATPGSKGFVVNVTKGGALANIGAASDYYMNL